MSTLDGRLFVVHADISDLAVDVIIVPTSTAVNGTGATISAVMGRYPEFRDACRGQSLELGSVAWSPLRPRGRGQVRGIVTACVTTIAALSSDEALETAESTTSAALLLAANSLEGAPYITVALPIFLSGDGGHGVRASALIERQMRAAVGVISAVHAEGKTLDVVLVAYTHQLARIARAVRRGVAPISPSVPHALAEALKSRACALVVGAGLSFPAGFPTWAGLLKLMGAPESSGSLIERADAVDQATVSSAIRAEFVDAARERSPTPAHYLLASVSGRLLLTTNYDSLLERTLSAQRRTLLKVVGPDEVKQLAAPSTVAVVKLHGDAETDPDSIVLKTADYESFDENRAAVSLVLEEALLTHTLLFVGYGLGDEDFHRISARVANRLKTTKQVGFAVLFDGEAKSEEVGKHVGHEIAEVRLKSDNRSARMLRFLDDLSETVSSDPVHLLGRDDEEVSVSSPLRPLAETLRLAADAGADAEVQNAFEARTVLSVIDLAVHLGWRPMKPRTLSEVYARLARNLPKDSFEEKQARSASDALRLRKPATTEPKPVVSMKGESSAKAKTSDTHPIFVSWLIEDLPGKVGLTFAPGKHAFSKYGGGRWERDLKKDLDVLVSTEKMALQVCLLEDHELGQLKIPDLIDEANKRGVVVRRLPIPDAGVLPVLAPVEALVTEVVEAAKGGKNVVIHCMGGLGRAGTIGGCALVALGLTADDALARLEKKRGKNCPETEGQRRFIRDFAAKWSMSAHAQAGSGEPAPRGRAPRSEGDAEGDGGNSGHARLDGRSK